jgi:hypothetical protein
MIFMVVGLPGQFAELCQMVAAELASHTVGPIARSSADTLAEIFCNMLQSPISHAVIGSNQPGGQIRRALIKAGRPFIVALDDPRAVLADLTVRRGVALHDATRIVASSCASCLCLSRTPGGLVLKANGGTNDPGRLTALIAAHLQVDFDETSIAKIVSGLGQGEPKISSGAADTWWEALDSAERAIAAGALGIYLDPATSGLGSLNWAPSLFFAGDQVTEPLSGSIDITGRARRLLRGPQIMLPPGIWSLAATFDFSADAADHSFVVEVTAGAPLSRIAIRPAGAGAFEVQLPLAIYDLPDHPIEIHLYNEKPAFGGELTLLGVTLTIQPAVATETAADDRKA